MAGSVGERNLDVKNDKIPIGHQATFLNTSTVEGIQMNGCVRPFKKTLGLLVDRIDTEMKIVAVVHDEILIECLESRSGEAAAVLKSIMEDAVNGILLAVPTTVELVVSSSWAEK